MTVHSPPSKRIKLEELDDEVPLIESTMEGEGGDAAPKQEDDEMSGDHCSICLQPLADRTVIPACSHEFCFECLLVWTGQCQYLLHNLSYIPTIRLCFVPQSSPAGVHCVPVPLENISFTTYARNTIIRSII